MVQARRDPRRRGWASRWAAPGVALTALAALWPRHGRRVLARPATPEQFEAVEPGRGRTADAPWRIPARGWKDILWRTSSEVRHKRLPAAAASVTFFGLLALFPALTAFVSLYGIFTDVSDVRRHFGQLADFMPRDAVSVIGQQLMRVTAQHNTTLGATLLVSTLIAIWSANAGTKALVDGVNNAYDEREKRPWLRRTLVCYAATLGGLLFLSLATIALLGAPAVMHAGGLHHVRFWWIPLRWLTIYLLAAVVFTLLYRHAPSRAPARWRWVASGGAAAALLWMIGSLVFSRYLDSFTHFGLAYGSLGTIMGLMLWMWFSVLVVLIGAELNAEIEHQTARDTTAGGSRPLGERGAVVADAVGEAFTVSPREARHYLRDTARDQLVAVARLLGRLSGGRRRL